MTASNERQDCVISLMLQNSFLHHYAISFFINFFYKTPKITCRSESMPSKLRRRLRSTVSPFLSRSICSKIPSTVRLWTAESLTMCVRNSSSPVSLPHYSKKNNSRNNSVWDFLERMDSCLLNSPYGGKEGVLEDVGAIQKEENTTDHDLEKIRNKRNTAYKSEYISIWIEDVQK